MSKKFKQLLVPEGYRHYWSKYPEGYTILEALLNWVDSVNQLTENVNDWNIYLDDFVENFDEKLRPTVREMLNEMEQDGRLAEIINEEIFSHKADKTYVDAEFSQINTQLSETSTQLSQIGTIPLNIIADNATDNSVALQVLFDSIKDNDVIIFPKSSNFIHFTQHLKIEYKHNFKIIFTGAKLYDEGKQIPFTDASSGNNPVGISIVGCTGFEIIGLTHDSAVDRSGEIPASQTIERVPQIDFRYCSNFRIDKMTSLGLVGGYLSLTSVSTPEDMMRASYFRFVNCSDFEVEEPTIAKGSGGGEFLSFTKSKRYKVLKPTHYQDDAPTTFWSMGKMIGVEDVEIDDIRVQSDSTGSLFDVSGKNIKVLNSNVDYPRGKFVDITMEWGVMGGDTDDVLLKDIRTNGTFSITADTSDVTIDNVALVNCDTTEETVIMNREIKNLHIKNTVFKNKRYIARTNYTNPLSNFHKNVTYENVDITFDGFSNLTELQTHGTTIYNGGKIYNTTNGLGVQLTDIGGLYNNITDMRNSPNTIEFNKTHFENIEIQIQSNVKFNGCTFKNVRFRSLNTTFQHVSVDFDDYCQFTFTSSNPIVSNAEDYFEFNNGSPNYLSFGNAKFSGAFLNNSTLPIFHYFTRNGSKISFKDGHYSVMRDSGGTMVVPTYFAINEESHITINVNGSVFERQHFAMLTGGSTGNADKVVINSNGAIYETNGIYAHSSTNTPATNSKVDLILTGNQMPDSLLTSLENKSTEFNKWVTVANAGI